MTLVLTSPLRADHEIIVHHQKVRQDESLRYEVVNKDEQAAIKITVTRYEYLNDPVMGGGGPGKESEFTYVLPPHFFLQNNVFHYFINGRRVPCAILIRRPAWPDKVEMTEDFGCRLLRIDVTMPKGELSTYIYFQVDSL